MLLSDDGADVTTIDCQGSPIEEHIAIFLDNGEDTSSVIDAFTITGAYKVGFSGAMLFLHAGPTVKNCVVTNNDISDITYSNYSGSGRLVNCRIVANASHGIGYGGPFLDIVDCDISYNGNSGMTAMDDVHMRNTTVIRNNGYGLHVLSGFVDDVIVENCTFADNLIGIRFEWEPPRTGSATSVVVPTLLNNVIAYNREYGVNLHLTNNPILYCNNWYGNPFGDLFLDYTTIGDSTGNISEDPLFCDTITGDYELSYNSPWFPANNSCAVLMGALPQRCVTCCKFLGDLNHSGPPSPCDIADLTYLVDYLFVGGPRPVCEEEADLDASGSVDVADLTYLVDYLFLGGSSPGTC